MKAMVFLIALGLLGLTSCTSHTDLNKVAQNANPLRLLLVKYYISNGQFPNQVDSLKSLDPNFRLDGVLWNGWNYIAYANWYKIWFYPARTRQSLWLKLNVGSPSESGWFLHDEGGDFVRQDIPLLPQEQQLLRKGLAQ